ncbi:MAG: fibronectin type III domain-containing protein, partial [bacterium]|nr:fibronectin type III domain-containing protein [bacterium]
MLKETNRFIQKAPVIIILLTTLLLGGCFDEDKDKDIVIVKDTTAPHVSNSGYITVSNLTATSAILNWNAASDNTTSQENLNYLIYQSDNNNISTIEDMEANGTLIKSGLSLSTNSLINLSEATEYWFNVIVMDEAGNKTPYIQISVMTKDKTDPVPDNDIITISNITSSSLTLTWTIATDNSTIQNNLKYEVYQSKTNNIDNVNNIAVNGETPVTADTGINTANISNLSEGTLYYFNVIVSDEYGNKSAYNMVSQKINDATSPVAGNFTDSNNITSESITLNWSSGSDNVTPDVNLRYLLYKSESNNINSVADMKNNGVLVGEYTNILTSTVNNLQDNTTYYFNLILKDEAGNETACNTKTEITLKNYSINVIVTGLPDGDTIILQNNTSSETITIDANGTHEIAAGVTGTNYAVSVNSAKLYYEILNGSGAIDSSDVNILVTQNDNLFRGTINKISPNLDTSMVSSIYSDIEMVNGSIVAVMVWTDTDGSNKQIYKSEFRNGSWSHPANAEDNITPNGQDAVFCALDIDSNGIIKIVWKQSDGTNQQVFLSEYRDGSWHNPDDLLDNISPDGHDVYSVKTASNDNGDMDIIWLQTNIESEAKLFKSEYRNGLWEHPDELSDCIKIKII